MPLEITYNYADLENANLQKYYSKFLLFEP